MDATWKLRIGREVQAGTAVITLTGRIGSEASGQLMDALNQTIDEGHRRILVDLERVDYVSSAGLLALDAAAGRLYGVGGALVLCAVCEPVRVVLDMAGVLTDLPVEPSKEAGLARLREQSAD